MLTGKKYRGEAFDSDFDAIVIGSGVGGLAVAGTLSRYGKKVLVLEAHYTAGGMTHTYMRKGYEWDVGVHYVGAVHQRTHPLRMFFDYLSDGHLDWSPLGDPYDCIWFPEKQYELRCGIDAFKDVMLEDSPSEAEALNTYLSLADESCTTSDLLFGERMHPPHARGVGEFSRKIRPFTRLASKSVSDVLATLSSNVRFKGLLTSQWGNFGLPPGLASFAMQAMCTKHYMDGGSYPVGGSGAIPETFVKGIVRHGGSVVTNAKVARILLHDGSACGVELHDGAIIKAPTVIAAGGIRDSFLNVLSKSESSAKDYSRRFKSLKPSLAHICLYCGLNGSPSELELPRTNHWVYPSDDHDQNVHRFLTRTTEQPPFLFISFPSAKDPTWEGRFPGKATAEVMAYAPYEWFKTWEDTEWSNRGDAYEEHKQRLSEDLLKQLYRVAPQLRDKVAYHELSTPLSTRHFTNHSHGEIYGVEHSPQRFANYWLRPQTTIPGLYLSGQDISTNGVGGALYGGLLTASTILQKNCVVDIVTGQAPVLPQRRENASAA